MRFSRTVSLVGLLAACGGRAPEPAASPAASPSPPATQAASAPARELPPPAREKFDAEPKQERPDREEFKASPKSEPGTGPDPEKSMLLRANHLGFTLVPPVLAQPAAGDELRLNFLDVGQGDSTLIECPGGQRILMDGGSGTASSSSPERARNHLRRALGTSMSIDMVLVSHPDRDHYNALPYLLDGVTVGHITVVGAANEYSGAFVNWFDGLPANRKTRITAESHDPKGSPSQTMACGSAEIYVLSVAATGPSDDSPKNSLSMVLMVTHGNFDAILTADATFVTENKILGWYPHWWLESELLKLGHHGSSTTSSGNAWVNAVSPDIAVVSSGFENTHGHPRKVVVERVAQKTNAAGAHAFRWYATQTSREDLPAYREAIYGSGTSGNIVVGSDGSRYWIQRDR